MSKNTTDELREQLRNLRRPSNTDAGYPIHAFEDDLVGLIQQEIAKARIDENRRAGAWWGGLVSSNRLNKGMGYMNERDKKLQSELSQTLKELEAEL